MPGDASYPPIRRLSPEERADLVKDLLAGRVFTVKHIPDGEQALAGLIFLPIGLGIFDAAPPEYQEQVGMIYEHRDRALERSVRGFPVFDSLKVIHKDDWIEVLKDFVDQHNALDKALMEKFGIETKPA